jgi:hypothetical protein
VLRGQHCPHGPAEVVDSEPKISCSLRGIFSTRNPRVHDIQSTPYLIDSAAQLFVSNHSNRASISLVRQRCLAAFRTTTPLSAATSGVAEPVAWILVARGASQELSEALPNSPARPLPCTPPGNSKRLAARGPDVNRRGGWFRIPDRIHQVRFHSQNLVAEVCGYRLSVGDCTQQSDITRNGGSGISRVSCGGCFRNRKCFIFLSVARPG